MDKQIQNSLLKTITNIVNKDQICEECINSELSEYFEECLNVFEQKFEIQLTEEQESQLIDVGLNYILSNKKAKTLDLNEDINVLINENSPEDVFCYIVEFLGALVGAASAASLVAKKLKEPSDAQKAAKKVAGGGNGQQNERDEETTDPFSATNASIQQAIQGGMNPNSRLGSANDQSFVSEAKDNPSYLARLIRLGKNIESSKPGKGKRRRMGTSSQEGESTTDPFSSLNDAIRRAQAQSENPNSRLGSEFRDYLGESVKKKKKLFKIIFVEKGVKKKGTAVSHKGVTRIIHGKQTFKVFDENNRDVTSQFKSRNKVNKK